MRQIGQGDTMVDVRVRTARKRSGAGSTVASAISGPSTEKEAAFPLQCVKNHANARAQTANGFREVLVTLHQYSNTIISIKY